MSSVITRRSIIEPRPFSTAAFNIACGAALGARFGFGAQQHFIALELAALDQGDQTLDVQSYRTAAQGGMQAIYFRGDFRLLARFGGSARRLGRGRRP